jgi:hypothetical protein
MSIDRGVPSGSRFVAAWASGPRAETVAEAVVTTTRQRTAEQVGIPDVSAGGKPDAETIWTT